MKDIYQLNKRLEDFQGIAKKIVQTDLLLQKFSEKERECESLKASLESCKKENETLEQSVKRENALLEAKLLQLERAADEKVNAVRSEQREVVRSKDDEINRLHDDAKEMQLLNDRLKEELDKLKSELNASVTVAQELRNELKASSTANDLKDLRDEQRPTKVQFYLNDEVEAKNLTSELSKSLESLSDDEPSQRDQSLRKDDDFKMPTVGKEATIDKKFSAIFEIDDYAKGENLDEIDEKFKEKIESIEKKSEMSFLFGDDDLDEPKETSQSSSSSSSSYLSSSAESSSSEDESEKKKERHELTDEFKAQLVENEIDLFIGDKTNEILIDSLVDELQGRVIAGFINDLVSLEAEKLSIIEQNIRENATVSVFNSLLEEKVSDACKTIATECLRKQSLMREVENEAFFGLLDEVCRDFVKNFVKKERMVEKYSVEYVETLINACVEEQTTSLAKYLKDLRSNIDLQVNYVYQSLIDKVIPNEIENLATTVYASELKTRKLGQDISYIFTTMDVKPLLLPIKDQVRHERQVDNTMLHQGLEIDESSGCSSPEPAVKKGAIKSKKYILPSSSSSSSDSENSVEEGAKVTEASTTLSDMRLKTTITPPSGKQTTKHAASSMDTHKGQIRLLNKIKRSDSSVTVKTAPTTRINTADLAALIKSKKKALDQEMGIQQKEQLKNKRKRQSIEDTNNSTMASAITPIKKATTRSPSPMAKRYHPEVSFTPFTPHAAKTTSTPNTSINVPFVKDRSNLTTDNLTPIELSQQMGYIAYNLGNYFKTFNVTKGFRFEQLDLCIEKFISPPKSDFSVDLFSNVLIKHFMNNNYIPITEKSHDLTKEHFQNIQNNNFLYLRLTNEEEKYIYLINKLKTSERFTNIYHDIILKLKTFLLSSKFNNFFNIRISRFICFLCKSNKDLKLMQTVMYDMVFSKLPNFHALFSIFARIWPQCLEYPIDENEIQPMITVIMHLTRVALTNLERSQGGSGDRTPLGDENASRWKFFVLLFERFCNWRVKYSSAAELYAYLMPKLKPSEIFENGTQRFTSQANEYLLSFLLLCKFEGWTWTYDVFIKQFIADVLSKWAEMKHESHSIGKAEAAVDDNQVAFMLYLECHLVAFLCQNNEHVIEAVKLISLFIKEQNAKISSLVVQFTIIECILLLVPREPKLCFTEIQLWLKPSNQQIHKSLPDNLKAKIRSVYSMYKDKLPNYLAINI